jgi:diacylglycerol kinase family enzyme
MKVFLRTKTNRNVDGELISGDKFEIKLMPNALKLDINPYFWNMKF